MVHGFLIAAVLGLVAVGLHRSDQGNSAAPRDSRGPPRLHGRIPDAAVFQGSTKKSPGGGFLSHRWVLAKVPRSVALALERLSVANRITNPS